MSFAFDDQNHLSIHSEPSIGANNDNFFLSVSLNMSPEYITLPLYIFKFSYLFGLLISSWGSAASLSDDLSLLSLLLFLSLLLLLGHLINIKLFSLPPPRGWVRFIFFGGGARGRRQTKCFFLRGGDLARLLEEADLHYVYNEGYFSKSVGGSLRKIVFLHVSYPNLQPSEL